MKKVTLLLFILIFSFAGLSSVFGQVNITKEQLLLIPDEVADTLIGIRTQGDVLYAVGMNGHFIKHNLNTGETVTGKTKAGTVVDFALIMGRLIYLDRNNMLRGNLKAYWPKLKYKASVLEAQNGNVLLSGSQDAYYLSAKAKTPIVIKNMEFAVPVKNGFIWSMHRKGKIPAWYLELYDCNGNFLKDVYKFSDGFHPVGLFMGPVGPEGGLLLSYYRKDKRQIMMVGQNGHIFWQLTGPDKFCLRDVAFDNEGNLLVVETLGKHAYIYRWKMQIPEG